MDMKLEFRGLMVYGVTARVPVWARADVRPLRGFQAFEAIAVLGAPRSGGLMSKTTEMERPEPPTIGDSNHS